MKRIANFWNSDQTAKIITVFASIISICCCCSLAFVAIPTPSVDEAVLTSTAPSGDFEFHSKQVKSDSREKTQ